jgi:RNA polymerase sigma-70 factor, ECF subfamily
MRDAASLEALYREHAVAVFRFALGLSRNRTEAEDIVAEAFARVIPRANAIKAATARAYLLTVARNVFLDARHRAGREAHALTELARELVDADAIDDHGASLGQVLRVLGTLPEGERAALLLRLDHDMSYEEIAAALNISLAAAKVRVHRARLKLASARSTGEWNNEG